MQNERRPLLTAKAIILHLRLFDVFLLTVCSIAEGCVAALMGRILLVVT